MTKAGEAERLTAATSVRHWVPWAPGEWAAEGTTARNDWGGAVTVTEPEREQTWPSAAAVKVQA